MTPYPVTPYFSALILNFGTQINTTFHFVDGRGSHIKVSQFIDSWNAMCRMLLTRSPRQAALKNGPFGRYP